jgi:hypothetical protein
MAIILDANQAGILVNTISKCTQIGPLEITIPPNVIAELILWGKESSLKQLHSLNPRVGLPLCDVISELKKSNEEGIRNFQPFYNYTKNSTVSHDDLINTLNTLSSQHKQWARNLKNTNLNFSELMKSKSLEFSKKLGDLKSKGQVRRNPKVSTAEEAFIAFGKDHHSFIGMIVKNVLSIDAKRQPFVIGPEKLYNAVMANPFVGGFFKTLLCYIMSFSRMWDHERKHLNFGPEGDRDDWIDMTIPLYAAPGDTVLTEDKKLCNVITAVYGKNIIVKKAADLSF